MDNYPITNKYILISRKLAEQMKTGRECAYCGNPNVQHNNYGVFCAGCGIEKRKELGQFMGIPIYDLDDAIALAKENLLFSFAVPNG